MSQSPLSIDRSLLHVAVQAPALGGSSDYDLNPEIRAQLPPTRRLRPAAVLCGLVDRGDGEGWRVILTRRADHLNRHAGQVAFPGGRIDPEDASPEAAALREAEEEIGLSPRQVELLGPIDGHETVTGYTVTPFVGFVDRGFVPRPDPAEVAEVFEPPLAFLMDPANRRRNHREGPGGRRQYWAMPWEGRYIWGATARMLVSLSDRIAAAAARETAE
jgi:8-oxo-dGTP pyrophosphatase MutT (NUDIX family)